MLVVIVVYNKAISKLPLLKKIGDKKLDLFIYDNSKLAQEVPYFRNINIFYEHDPANSGVSRAYNQAYKKASNLRKKLLLLLDQDTMFDFSFIDKYLKAYNKYSDNYLYAPIVTNIDKTKIYSPGYFKNFVGKVQDRKEFDYNEVYSLNNKSVINSGLMIPLSIFKKIGGFNEKLKLDFSDAYFIEKYKVWNNKIILVDIDLVHSLSGDEGRDYEREYNRFKFYCCSAKEVKKNFNIRFFWAPLRRLIRLILKYKKITFIKIYYNNYLKGNIL